jgi:hypothetical protein
MCVADIPCINRGVWGHTPPEKFMLTILVFEIKEGKKTHKKFKKILTIIYHYY